MRKINIPKSISIIHNSENYNEDKVRELKDIIYDIIFYNIKHKINSTENDK